MKRVTLIASLVPIVLTMLACCFGQNGFGNFTVSGPTTTIAPGFAPDPMLIHGTAGGPTDASTLRPECRGFLSLIPSQTLALTAPMSLRIMAHSDQDTTLVVQLADGTYVCNDDSDGVDPLVEHAFPAGNHNVFVGTYASGTSAQYTLGITTNPTVTPSTMQSAGPLGMIPGGPIGPGGAGGAAGTPADGPVLVTGTATVAMVTGNLPGVTAGTVCTYTQMAVVPPGAFDCRWRVECGGTVVYGEGGGGFNPCRDPSWPPGVLVADSNTESNDGDPSLIINPGGMSVRSDAQGSHGEITITATLSPTAPPQPIPG
jgi:hypothetical protein